MRCCNALIDRGVDLYKLALRPRLPVVLDSRASASSGVMRTREENKHLGARRCARESRQAELAEGTVTPSAEEWLSIHVQRKNGN